MASLDSVRRGVQRLDSSSTRNEVPNVVYKRGAYNRESASCNSFRQNEARIEIGGRELKLTNLNKLFWPEQGISKRDLLQYYAEFRRYCCRI